ncbi:hypothetical protein ACPOL_1791 [Acidisarcina polymorpha]|uniref:Outer membrane protein beta-barrel domain-containing protein n=1 Tax=Acidisarcina polymorpha TaxID=2211140 RepID=A0A2Z5FW67_9BACT|nr:porin family protein [Acidisarcina polymorpha]AXC11133.1 hypothetical protein ACPOL_1791 [Acidisarcina polymorpha]
MEASKFVRHGKRLGRKARLLFFPLFLICPLFLSAQVMLAQTDPAPAPSQQPADASPAPPAQAQQPAVAPPAPPAQTPEERARIIRDAQARINARRQARIQQIIRETYGAKFEGYFGGGYLRFHPGDTKQHINEADWNIGITDYLRPRLGVTADFRGYYGTAYIGNNPYAVFEPGISQYSILFGPQYRVYERPKWAATIQALAGFGHGNFDTGTGGLPASLIGLYNDGTVFSFSVGAPLDYNLSPSLALRLTPLYLFTNYGSSVQNNLGFNAGVVYRWGKQ